MEIIMGKAHLARTWLFVTILATLGLVMGVVMADALSGREKRFTAQATLAMLPERNIPLEQVSSFWEVLNRGQATASAAIVLKDGRWLDSAAAAAGVPKSELTLSAGAIPDTTLITVTMKAQSARAAEAALDSVLADAVRPAAEIAGPFRLETVVPPDGSATAMAPTPIQMFGALGIAGLLVGAGAGLLVSRFIRELSARKPDAPVEREDPPILSPTASHDGAAKASDEISSVEISLR
jgi:hypothetical protein